MGKVKSILFKAVFEGKGVVNYEGCNKHTEHLLNEHCGYHYDYKHENQNIAKRVIMKNDEGTGYKDSLKVSSNCIRRAIFGKNVSTNNILSNDKFAMEYVSSLDYILRGRVLASKDTGKNKTSSLCISYLQERNNSLITNDVHTTSSEQLSSNSYYYKDEVGKVIYDTDGFILLNELEFMCADNGATELKSSWLEHDNNNEPMLNAFFRKRYGRVPYAVGYYSDTTDLISYSARYGIKFDDEFRLYCVKQLLKLIYKAEITRTQGAYLYLSELKIKLNEGYNSTKRMFDGEDGWITIKSERDIDDLEFEPFDFFKSVPEEDVIHYRNENKRYIEEQEQLRKKDKEEKESRKKKKSKSEDNAEQNTDCL